MWPYLPGVIPANAGRWVRVTQLKSVAFQKMSQKFLTVSLDITGKLKIYVSLFSMQVWSTVLVETTSRGEMGNQPLLQPGETDREREILEAGYAQYLTSWLPVPGLTRIATRCWPNLSVKCQSPPLSDLSSAFLLFLTHDENVGVKSKETVGNSWTVLKVILGHKYHHSH